MAAYKVKPEHTLQASTASFFKSWMVPDMLWTSVDHGITFAGSLNQRRNTWQRLAARGVQTGIHDMPIIFYKGRLHSIELKDIGQELEDTQIEWGRKVIAQGGTWDVCETRAQVWASMCRAFPDDNPLKPPPAMLQIWLAKDALPPKVRTPKRPAKPRADKPTRSQVERGNRISGAMAKGYFW